MNRLYALCASTMIGAAMAASPAAAQEENNERVMMVQIPQGGECPTSPDDDTIVVCEEIEDPYRIPSELRQSNDPANRSWSDRARDLETVGRFGPGSCTNIGGGSELGCSIQEIEEAVAERENAPERRYSILIEEARRERLETIEGEAARTQARVEELERAYLERLEAERDAPLPGEEEPLPEVEGVDADAVSQDPNSF
ncbi:hypothetical protein [Alteraurantiacibacter aquimixticola]|uniref:DUF4124 domain-containing protein n=1 Tax=Alteraurantiacibacter aquimixticola TaxID=2489173 RepID=A0A4V4U8A9_9SPHN|nr:hypothetical protein [Alteraurantiacibacter aquimixticola]TIX49187.1 hypothetical protein E5222_15855 [Alteraurantiacibacter aquimixticola]